MSSEQKIGWTPEFVRQLIAEAERRPCIWKKGDRQYLNKFAKADAFKEIAATLGVTAVREKVRNLRINFMQLHRKKSSSGSAATPPPKWEYYKDLLFLAAEVAAPGETDSLSLRPETGNEENADLTEFAETGERPTSNLVAPSRSRGRKRQHEEFSNVLKPLFDELTRTNEQIVSSETQRGPHQQFGEYVASTLEQCSHKGVVRRAKARIQLILSDALTECACLELEENEQ